MRLALSAIIIAGCLACLSTTALGQGSQIPRLEHLELFAGYSEIPGNALVQEPLLGKYGFEERTKRGWNLGLYGQVNSWVGFVFDVSGNYTPVKIPLVSLDLRPNPAGRSVGHASRYTFMAGPQLKMKTEFPIRPFARGLVGYSRYSDKLDPGFELSIRDREGSDDAFVYGAGAGVDWRMSRGLAIRLVQVDVLRLAGQDKPLTVLDYRKPNQTRWSFGLVVGF